MVQTGEKPVYDNRAGPSSFQTNGISMGLNELDVTDDDVNRRP